MKQLRITLGDQVAFARLLYDKAPKTCRLVEEYSPLRGRLNHAKVCKNEVFFQAPFFMDEKENPVLPGPGDIGFWAVRQTICLWYGETFPLGPTNLFAQVTKNLDGLAKECAKSWQRQGEIMTFEVVEVADE